MRYPLIVFDWDGTIIDSTGSIAECIQQAAAEMGLPVPDEERAVSYTHLTLPTKA